MNRTLCVMVLLLGCALLVKSSATPGASPTSPVILVKRRLLNQTAPISNKTIFTSAHDGVYRLSTYAVLTTPGPSSTSIWEYSVAWTDDAGPESAPNIYYQFGQDLGQFFSNVNASPLGGLVTTFEAKAGTDITYTVSQVGPPDGSAYSLYYVLEEIE
jgi:hypothetical protein